MFAKLYDMQKIKEVIEQAVLNLRRNKHLPIYVNEIKDLNKGNILVNITDFKLQRRKDLNTTGVFPVIIFKNVYTDFNTIAIDNIANIPANLSGEKRALLRIAYTIFYHHSNNIMTIFKTVETNKNLWTLNNAWKWYEEL